MKFNTRVTPREIESSIKPRIVYQDYQKSCKHPPSANPIQLLDITIHKF
jgi:hypothetical protein